MVHRSVGLPPRLFVFLPLVSSRISDGFPLSGFYRPTGSGCCDGNVPLVLEGPRMLISRRGACERRASNCPLGRGMRHSASRQGPPFSRRRQAACVGHRFSKRSNQVDPPSRQPGFWKSVASANGSLHFRFRKTEPRTRCCRWICE